MKYSNELKVGLALVLSVLVFILGVRYFEDIPLFSGTYALYTSFEDASGLVSGNVVRVNGVNVGQVEDVRLSDDMKTARVRFHVNKDVRIPQGSTTTISGNALLGAVRMDIDVGPPGNPPYEPNAFIPSREDESITALLDQAPAFLERADSLLISVGAAVGGARDMLVDPGSELQQTLVAIQGSAHALNQLMRTEQERLGRVLENVAVLTANLNAFTDQNSDSLRMAVQNLNRVLTRLDRNMATLEQTTAGFDAVVAKVERGDGTLGLLVNDPALYHRLDSTLNAFNTLLADFQKNPKRYLKDLKLVDVF